MRYPAIAGLHRTGLFILLLACEAAIIVFGSHYFNVFRTNKNLTYNLIVSAAFLTVSLWFRYDQQMKAYWPLAFALFMASTAIPISALLTPWNRVVLSWLSVSTNSSQGLAIDKVWEVLVKTIPILVLVRLSGADFKSVFLQRGQLKSGLGIGALVFFFLGTASFMFAAERFTSLDRLMAAVVLGFGLFHWEQLYGRIMAAGDLPKAVCAFYREQRRGVVHLPHLCLDAQLCLLFHAHSAAVLFHQYPHAWFSLWVLDDQIR
jgi:hypothetical protein